MYTREQWARAFLGALGNNHPTQNVVNWVVAWTRFESATGRGASYNLLNTTQREAGSTVFNSVGVQNFTSFSQGVQANAATLENGRYPALLDALRTNNESALGFGQSSPSSGVLSALNTWCGSCGYGNQFVSISGQGLTDQFPGTTGGTSIPSSSTQSSQGASSSGSPTPPDIGSSILSALGLPSPSAVASAFQSIGLFMFGGILILMGFVVLFVREESKSDNAS